MNLFISLFLLFSLNSFAFEDGEKAYEEALSGKAIIIDVREKDELQDGMIKEAVSFPLSKLEAPSSQWLGEFKVLTKGKNIYLYCRSGKRAQKSLEILKKNGIESKNIGGWETLKGKLPTTEK